MRAIGLDIHRGFCEVAIAEDGVIRSARRIGTAPDELEVFAASLEPSDVVTLEATGNAAAIARILESHVRVVLANPKATKAATRLRAKTDRIDARTLAQLLASGFLPAVWQPDATTAAPRRQVSRRAPLVKRRTKAKNQVHAALIRTSSGGRRRATCSVDADASGWPGSSCRPTSATASRPVSGPSTSSTPRSPVSTRSWRPPSWAPPTCAG